MPDSSTSSRLQAQPNEPSKDLYTALQTVLKGANTDWVSLSMFANALGEQYRTVFGWVKSDPPKLRAKMVRGHWRVYNDEIRRFLVDENYISKEATEAYDQQHKP